MNSCRFIITDSGGIQEEASFLKKKLIVCRQTTERLELVGNFVTLAPYPSKLEDLVDQIYNDFLINEPCPYGDGKSWIKIKEILSICKYI
jgi:UDP-N-acetylglucosamine 2-epimerase (non-hydrolysing)